MSLIYALRPSHDAPLAPCVLDKVHRRLFPLKQTRFSLTVSDSWFVQGPHLKFREVWFSELTAQAEHLDVGDSADGHGCLRS